MNAPLASDALTWLPLGAARTSCAPRTCLDGEAVDFEWEHAVQDGYRLRDDNAPARSPGAAFACHSSLRGFGGFLLPQPESARTAGHHCAPNIGVGAICRVGRRPSGPPDSGAVTR